MSDDWSEADYMEVADWGQVAIGDIDGEGLTEEERRDREDFDAREARARIESIHE